MFGRNNLYIGLDIGSWAVKAVALQPNKGRMTLLGYAQQRIGDQDPAIVIRQVIAQLGVKPANIVSSVSGRSVIVRQVETPQLDKSELAAHIRYEADKYIPFGADQVEIGCQALPHLEGEDSANQQVQLVAVRRGFIEDHISLLHSAGLHPKVIDVDVFAICNAYEVFGPVQTNETPPAIALVDIGASKVCVAIVKGDRPLFTREFYLAGNEITDAISRSFNESPEDIEEIKLSPGDTLDALLDAAMPAVEDLANEIRLSFDYVDGQFDETVSQVILTGGSSQMDTLGDILGNILSCSVQVFDPLAGIDLIPSKYDIQNLDANAPALTVALGLACHLASKDIKSLGGQHVAQWQARGSQSSVVRPSVAPQTQEQSQEAPQENRRSDNATVMDDLNAPETPAPAFNMPDDITPTMEPILAPGIETPPAPAVSAELPIAEMAPATDTFLSAPPAAMPASNASIFPESLDLDPDEQPSLRMPSAVEMPEDIEVASVIVPSFDPAATKPQPVHEIDSPAIVPSIEPPVEEAAVISPSDNPFDGIESNASLQAADDETRGPLSDVEVGSRAYSGNSSVLVILDDDDEDVPPQTQSIVRRSTRRINKDTGTTSKGKQPSVRIDSFEDDDEDAPPSLPSLG